MARRKYNSDYNSNKGMYSKAEYERKNSQAGSNGYSKADFIRRYNSGYYDERRKQFAEEEEVRRQEAEQRRLQEEYKRYGQALDQWMDEQRAIDSQADIAARRLGTKTGSVKEILATRPVTEMTQAIYDRKKPYDISKLLKQEEEEKQKPAVLLDPQDAMKNWAVKEVINGARKDLASTGYEGFHQDKEKYGDSGEQFMTAQQMREFNKFRRSLQKEGRLDMGNDQRFVSDEGLQKWIDNRKAEAETAAEKAEKIKTEYENSRPSNSWQGVLELVEKKEGLNRPAGYDRYTQQEYDEALYDSVYGKGKYSDRIDALETDEDAAALDDELSAMWDRLTPEEISKFDGGESLKNREAAEERRKETTARANEFFRMGYDNDLWAEDTTPEEKREALFDYMMGGTAGRGAYADLVSSMTPEEKAELDSRLDEVYSSANAANTNTWADHEKEYNENMIRSEAYKKAAESGEKEQGFRDELKNYTKQAEELKEQGYTGQYKPELVPENKWIVDEEDTEGRVYNVDLRSEVDKAYQIINTPDSMDPDRNMLDTISKYEFLSDDPENNQVEQFNIFYEYDKQHGTNKAGEFLKGLDSYLQSMVTEYQDMYAREASRDGWRGVANRIASYPAKVFTGLIGTAGTFAALMGNESAKDPNSGWYAGDKFFNVLRDQQNEDIDKALGGTGTGKFFLSVIDSIADNMMAMGAGKALAAGDMERSMRLVQAIMSGSATSGRMAEMLQKGASPTEAALYAIGNGAIEWITEKYSLEELLKPDVKAMLGNKKQLAGFIAKNIAAEGSEEMASDLLNIALDSVLSIAYGHETELMEQYRQLVADGMSPQEATSTVLGQMMQDIGMSGLAGGLSGGFMAGGRAMINSMSQRSEGSNIRQNNSMNKLLELAAGMKEGTQSRLMAEEMLEKKHAGTKPTNVQMGKLAQLMVLESNEQTQEVAKTTLERQITEELKEKNVENASEYSRIITDSLMNDGKMDVADRMKLAKSKTAIDVWKAYNTVESLQTARARVEIAQKASGQQSIIDQISGMTANKARATGALANEINRSLKETNNMAEAIDNLQERRSGLLSEKYASLAKELLESDKNAKNSRTFLDDAMKIRMAAMTLSDVMPKTNLGTETAQKLFEAARNEFDEIDAQRIKNQVKVVPGKGMATFDGAQYGTEAWTKKLDGLTKDQRYQLKALAEITLRMGNRLNIINDTNHTGVYGFEDETGTVTINAAGLNRNGMQHHMLVTMSHELTHWLEQNSAEGYKQLRGFVLSSLRSKGQNIEQMIADTIDNQNAVLGAESGNDLDINGAMAEIVAKSCENLLSSKAIEAELAKTNPELHGKIRNFVKKFVARLRAAVQGMAGSLSREARTLYNETEKIAQIWLGARQEALSTEEQLNNALEEAINNPVVRFSVESPVEMRKDGLVAVHNITPDALVKTMELGGFAGPSISVMAAGKTWTDYGPISVFFGRDMVDPKANKANNLFSGDAYTPTLSSEQTYSNMKEAMDYLKKQNVSGRQGTPFAAPALSMGFRRITNIEKARQMVYDNETVSGEVFNKVRSLAKEIEDDIVKNSSDTEGFYNDEISGAIFDIAEEVNKLEDKRSLPFRKKIIEGIANKTFKQVAKKYGIKIKQVTYETLDKIVDYVDITRDLPSEWLEAKSMRATGFNEGLAFLVPTSLDQSIIDKMHQSGISEERIHFYNDSSEDSNVNHKNRVEAANHIKYNVPGVQFSLVQYTQKQTEKWNNSKKIAVFDGNVNTIKSFIDESIAHPDPEHFKKMYFGMIDHNLAAKIKEKTGIDTEGLNLALASTEVQKVLVNSHGDPLYEKTRGQVQITAKEIIDAVKTIEDPDEISGDVYTGNGGNPQNAITFRKNIDGRESVFTYIATGPHDLRILTIYKGVQKKSLAASTDVQASVLTSETSRGTAPINNLTQKTKESNINYSVAESQDTEYEQAVKRKDWAKAEQILLDKYLENEGSGISGFNAAQVYDKEHGEIARKIKTGDPEAISRAAKEMAWKVPDNAVLIPMPPHTGEVTDTTDTMLLARAISELTGRPVIKALGSGEHISRKYAKENNIEMKAADMGFRQIAEIPANTMPVFIDNVVAGGLTAKAAHDAVGRGITLAYAYSIRNKTAGTKFLSVTNDSNKNPIPLSQRMDTDNKNWRYSVMQSPDMEVNNFMMGLQEFNLTAQERTMLRQYKGLRFTAELTEMKIRENEKALRKLQEKAKKEKLSVYDRDEMTKLNNRLGIERDRLAKVRREQVRATMEGGYAREMMKQDSLMKNLVNGVTADQLISLVSDMSRQLDELNRDMQERAAQLKELGQSSAVLQIRQQFSQNGLKRIAAQLKADMNSDLQNKEIENRLALIALKMKEGKFDAGTAEELTDMILGKMRGGYDSYVLSTLRGRKIALSPAQLKELKANHSGIREINAELAGTGIKVVASGGTNLEHIWGELSNEITSLDPDTNPLEQLNSLMNVIRSERNTIFAERFSNEAVQAASEAVLKAAAELVPEIVTDEKSMKMIRETLKYVQEISGQAEQAAGEISDMTSVIDRIKKTGQKAASGANKLTGDIGTAIRYFDSLSEQSEAAMWKTERLKLIDQLKSENTQNLLAEQEKWRQKIEKDKSAREKMESNLRLRKKINTNVDRVRKLLINETDIRNIPEHMKGLAREMLGRVVDNDLIGRKITGIERQDLMEIRRVLDAMEKIDGGFAVEDLRMMGDEEAQATVLDALADLEDGIGFYNNKPGKDLMANLQGFHNALNRISDAVSTITSVINAERSLSFLDRRMDLADAAEDIRRDMNNSRFKGELAGRGAKTVNMAKSAVFYGNMTPVYFFKTLRNNGLDMVWKDIQQGENRSGLETQKAKAYLEGLAEKTGYKEWADQKHEIVLGGQKMTVSIENMMELYAIWKREQNTNPEMSQHLSKGGVYIQEEADDKGLLRHEQKEQKAVRVTDGEIADIYSKMTDAQKEYLEGIVQYLSNDMSELGNEASMRMYGIKKYKESYYFPMKVWDGVKSARSDRGITGTDENRAAHRSWSKRRMHMAQNALVIGNFTQDAVNHIVEMINYNTMAPGIENMNKILNFQFTEGETEDNMTKRNLRVMFEKAYGREALRYLETFMKDMNGGVTQDQRKTLRDKALTMFKKNAVAGSLSVALQQPLSYIRAAMLISPKYLTMGLSPAYWKGSYQEMMQHSGVAVIKDMGRFDMNFGQSAKDFITPEKKGNLYEKVSDVLTAAPEMMDRMTWTRMWSAVKAEQKAQHPEMDVTSDKFLDMVGVRFNQLMRETQVYDSILVKSSNMRSQNLGMKLITSFMAEPTLSLNVLADAVGKVRAGDKGSIGHMAKAAATFLLSAVMQAAVKGAMGTGRTPDDKKTWLENFLNKLQYNLMNEANPASLIPGYSDIIELLKKGELKDDAMGALGKLVSVWDTAQKAFTGEGKGLYRDIEDTAGQLAQLFTNIPAKNLMRDMRAMRNWIVGDTYANRPSSAAVMKWQAIDNLVTADNLLGTINTKLKEAGFSTSNKAYYQRLYEAQKNKNTGVADELHEYLTLGKGVKEDTITTNLRTLTKKDDSMTPSQKIKALRESGMEDSDIAKWITTEFKEGRLKKEEAEKLYQEANPAKTKDDAYFHFEQVQWEKDTGNDTGTSDFFRLDDALNSGKTEYVKKAVKELKEHGYKDEKILDHVNSRIMKQYKEGTLNRKQAEEALKKYGGMKEGDVWWKIDRADYQKETGAESVSGYYYRLTDAVNANKAEKITKAVKDLLGHGITKEKIKNKLSDWKKEYLAADSAGRIRIRDAITKAYKAAGYTADDAGKTIDNWMKESKKKKN